MSNENKTLLQQQPNNNNNTSTASPPIPSVVDHTKKESSTAVSSNTKTTSKTKSKQDIETVTIPKEEYNSLNNRVSLLTQALKQTKSKLYGIQDAMTLVQSKVLEAKSSI